MAICLYCFFKDEYQNQLKRKAFGKSSFEETLKAYKDIYCTELTKISYVEKCSNHKRHLNQWSSDSEKYDEDGMGNWPSNLVSYLDGFCDDIKSHVHEIEEYFDEIIDIYESRSEEKFSEFIQEHCSPGNVIENFEYTRPWFRAREVGKYKPHDISEMFHIPYTKLNLTGKQRFSDYGQPYLYLAESMRTAIVEIGKSAEEVNAALFVPQYSVYYDKPVYNIENSMLKTLNTFVCLSRTGTKIVYGDNRFTLIKKNLSKRLADTVLFQIMQFPTQEDLSDNGDIPEYILPQIFMQYQMTKGMVGILYQSSKDIGYNKSTKFEEVPNRNLCLPAKKPENPKDNFDSEFLNGFFYSTYEAGEPLIDILSFEKELSDCKKINKIQSHTYNMNDFGIYLGRIQNHLEVMKEYCGDDYFQGLSGKIELTLMSRFLQKIRPIINDPEKYGLHSVNG